MRSVTKKWLFQKLSSAILLPLMIWFIINFVSIYDKSYIEIVNFFSSQPSKLLFSLFIIFSYFFSALTISEVFEDYIKDQKFKNAANRILVLFSIVMTLLLVIFLFKI